MLEETVAEITRLADPSATPAGQLTQYDNDLPPAFGEIARPLINALTGLIGQLSSELDLSPRHISRRRAIHALAVAETVRIEDSSVDALRGYGTVDPRARAVIQPVLDELHATLKMLAHLVAPS